MYYYYPSYGFFGMHVFWWAFWIVGLVLLFALATPVRRTTWRELSVTPLSVLQRRYAAGEISTAEYEERKAVLERDSRSSPDPQPSGSGRVAPLAGPPV
ncbi:MAG TPA: SHOCT domain-containing protein [Polyangiaceae bacterium]|nr:SHOCT domain-containing protein [Polyangiaceae bacterium]